MFLRLKVLGTLNEKRRNIATEKNAVGELFPEIKRGKGAI
jgi:hypothetical protein